MFARALQDKTRVPSTSIQQPPNTKPIIFETLYEVHAYYAAEVTASELLESMYAALKEHIWDANTMPIVFHIKITRPNAYGPGKTTPVRILIDVPSEIDVKGEMLDKAFEKLPQYPDNPWTWWALTEEADQNHFRMRWFLSEIIDSHAPIYFAKFDSSVSTTEWAFIETHN
ncbi:hypothetical protein BJY04DRAFT_180977 [Aspergillus karnatakaensis]|uniref:uncharacterized protein n=1 Tax=Aspergillus karnatakaensis TaxID=1810916 RepID=UPI003CCDA72E